MMILCIVGKGWDVRFAERVAGELLEFVPRTAAGEAGQVWADVRGLDVLGVSWRLLQRMKSRGEEVGIGVAASAIAANVAAVSGQETGSPVVVAAGSESEFLSVWPIEVLGMEPRLRQLLEGVGIEKCGELASVTREAVEVRFGTGAVEVWHRSRGEDVRRLFGMASSARAQAVLEFVDYVVTDPERLVFTANVLLGGLCEKLVERGSHARRMELVLPLANGETWRKILRPSRPTASRMVWLRQVRGVLERLTVPDAVAGVGLEVLETEAASAVQGDLFDAGFATLPAVEFALTRLIESQGPVVVRPETSAHPLAEQRTEYGALEAETVAEWSGARATGAGSGGMGLTLQLLREPRPIVVDVVERRDHRVPVRYRDGEWKGFRTVVGPERVSGGQWDEAYAREYFRGVTADGQLVWIYRDGRDDRWYLHGWWD